MRPNIAELVKSIGCNPLIIDPNTGLPWVPPSELERPKRRPFEPVPLHLPIDDPRSIPYEKPEKPDREDDGNVDYTI